MAVDHINIDHHRKRKYTDASKQRAKHQSDDICSADRTKCISKHSDTGSDLHDLNGTEFAVSFGEKCDHDRGNQTTMEIYVARPIFAIIYLK